MMSGKVRWIAVSVLVVLAVAFSFVSAEIVQLIPMHTRIEADPRKERTAAQLAQIESARGFIIEFISKWDPDRKFKAASMRYRGVLKSPDALRRELNKETYARIEFLKYEFLPGRPPAVPGDALSVKANVHWFSEGYDGITTYYFVLTQEQGAWVLDYLIH